MFSLRQLYLGPHAPRGGGAGSTLRLRAGNYAIAGAAAFTGGATHALAVILIVFELTEQLNNLLGVRARAAGAARRKRARARR